MKLLDPDRGGPLKTRLFISRCCNRVNQDARPSDSDEPPT